MLIRWVVAEYLRACGHQVIEAANAAEAIKLLRIAATDVDLVFSDVRMGDGLSGHALAAWVREHRPGVPVLLTSGAATTARQAEAACAANEFVPKPCDHGELLARMRRMMAGRTKGRPDALGRTGLRGLGGAEPISGLDPRWRCQTRRSLTRLGLREGGLADAP